MAKRDTDQQDSGQTTFENEPKFRALSDAVVGFIELGHTQRAAAALAGCSANAVSEWVTKGKRQIAAGDLNGDYAKFVAQITEARGRAQGKMENALFAAGLRGNVTAALAWLRARATDDWSEKVIVRTEGSTVTQDLSGKSDVELRQMMAEALEQASTWLAN